jgi:hypothetical protein
VGRLVAAAKFGSPIDAQRAVDLLGERGIRAFVGDEAAGTLLGLGSVLGFPVMVEEDDVPRALETLAEEDAEAAKPDPPEQEAALEAEALAAPDAESDEGASAGADPDDFVEEAEAPLVESERWAKQTRTIALIGVLVWPFFIGAVARLLWPSKRFARTPAVKRYLKQAWVCVVATLVVVGLAFWVTGIDLFAAHRSPNPSPIHR